MDMSLNKLLQLTSVGLILISISQIIWHFLDLPDLYNGAFIGTGIGLLLAATLNTSKKQPA